MALLHRYTVTQVLSVLLGIIVLIFVALSFFASSQIRNISVNGPLYNQITQKKDIIADVLPPPLFIIESYSTALEMLQEKDPKKNALLSKRLESLKNDYEKRYENWQENIDDQNLRKLLAETYVPAKNFFFLVDNQFIPAIAKNNYKEANRIAETTLKSAYEFHYSKIGEVVAIAKKEIVKTESASEQKIINSVIILIGLAFLFITSLTITLGWFIRSEAKTRKMSKHVIELEKTKEEMSQKTAKLELAYKELEAFSYSISHDLRAPLRSIDGWSFILLEDYGHQLNEEARGYLDRVRNEAQRMGDLIDDMLKLSQISRAEVSKSMINLSEQVETVAQRMKDQNPERDFQFDIEPNIVANGDAHLLDIVLNNLLSNACKFTSHTDHAIIKFGTVESEGRKAYYVKDNGVGFNMALAHQLYKPFQRLHKQNEFPGTGVGLAMVKRIITLHEGDVWAESTPGKGATFYFTLREPKSFA